MNIAQALEDCAARQRAGYIATDVQLTQWARERDRLLALIAGARRHARAIVKGEGDTSEHLAALCVLGMEVETES